MTSAGTDINTTTTSVGVNLPATATLNTAATPAAVFVQQASTLTIQDGGSLTVGAGSGPFYVADSASLTIDASGITTLTAANPSMMLVQGTIYGGNLISVTKPTAPEGYTIETLITDSGIVMMLQQEVSITSPFDGTTLSSPTVATVYNPGSTVTQTSFGNNLGYWQTVNNRDAIVAKVLGGTYSTSLNGFLYSNEAATDASRDVYLVSAGASARLVCGIQKCAWAVSPFTAATTGDAIVQLESGNAQYVFGAGSEGAYNSQVATVTGNTGVTVKGTAKITGSVFGGWGSSHQLTPTVSGNTAVRIENVQDTDTAGSLDYIGKGFVVGGSVFQANTVSQTTVSGNSSVTVAIDNGKTGTFTKKIIGGSLNPEITATDKGTGTQTVSRNTTVTISAPSGVSFPSLIVGGGYNGHQESKGTVSVGGNSSVTLNGGTFSGRIVAGGHAYASGAVTVGGTATLTINGGTFSSTAILDGGMASGTRTLVANDTYDFSGLTVQNFDAIEVAANKTLTLTAGQESSVGSITLGEGAKLKLYVEDENAYKYDGHIFYPTLTLGENAALEYYYNDGGSYTMISSDAFNGNNLLPYFQLFEVSNGTAGGNVNTDSNWKGGSVPNSRNAAFHVNTASAEGITINVDTSIEFGDIQIYGSGIVTFSGEGTLSCANLDIASGVTLKIGDSAIAVSNGKITGGGKVVVNSGATLALDGVTSTNPFTVNGKIETNGDTSLRNSTDFVFNYGSQLDVQSGETTLEMPNTNDEGNEAQGIMGQVDVAQTAVLSLESNYAINYSSNVTAQKPTILNLHGTLSYPGCWLQFKANNQVNLYSGALISGYYLQWTEANTLHVYGDAEITSWQRFQNIVLNVNVAENATATFSKIDTNNEYANAAVNKQGDGKLRIKNTSCKYGFTGSEGTLEFYIDAGASADTRFDTGTSTFSGNLLLTRGNASKYPAFGSAVAPSTTWQNLILTGEPSTTITGDWCIDYGLSNNYLTFGDLSGSGNFRCDYGTSNPANTRYLKVRTKSENGTTYSGVIMGSKGAARKLGLVVESGVTETVRSLTLTKASTTDGPLTIQNYGKVIFSGNGSWANGTITVKENGVLESRRNASLATGIVLEAGSTVAFYDGCPLQATTITLPTEGTVTLDLSQLTFATDTVTLISGLSEGDDAKFSVLQTNAEFERSISDGALVVTRSKYKWAANGEKTSVNDVSLWTSTTVPVEGDVIFEVGANTTMTIPENISFRSIALQLADGETSGKLTLTGAGKISASSVTVPAGIELVASSDTLETSTGIQLADATAKLTIENSSAWSNVVSGAGAIEIPGDVTVASADVFVATGSLAGEGTLTLPAGTVPSTALATLLQNASWQGTVVVSEYDNGTTALPLESWANAGASLKLVGVRGKVIGKSSTELNIKELILANGVSGYGLNISANPDAMLIFKRLSGNGTLKESSGAAWQTVIEFRDASDFEGSIEQTSQGGRIYVSNITSGLLNGQGHITVGTGYSIKIGDGNTWSAGRGTYRGGIQIQGTVTLLGSASMNTDAQNDSYGVTLHGGSKLVFEDIGTSENAKKLTVNKLYSQTGTVKIAFGANATLRDGATLIDWSAGNLASAPAQTFVFDKSALDNNWVLFKDTEGLKVFAKSVEDDESAAAATLSVDASGALVADVTTTGATLTVPSAVSKLVVAVSQSALAAITAPGVDVANVVVKYGETVTTGAYTITKDNGVISFALNPNGTVNDVTVVPVVDTTAESPMSASSQPTFTVKAIPGLWYQVVTGTSMSGTELAGTKEAGTAVQATTTTVSPAAPAFSGTVKFYKIAVGASQAALQ